MHEKFHYLACRSVLEKHRRAIARLGKWRSGYRMSRHMANEEQLGILKQGSAVWNKWRQDNPNIVVVDLGGAHLPKANLSGVNLTGAKPQGSKPQGSGSQGSGPSWG